MTVLGFTVAGRQRDAGGQQADAGGGDEITRLNDTILAELGSTWDRPSVFIAQGQRPLASAAQIDEMVAGRYLPDAMAALNSACGATRRIVIDDPRIALMPALWDAALTALGFTSRRVLVVGNPLDCADLLHRNNRLARPRGLQLWLRYTLAALSMRPAGPDQIICLDALRERQAAAVFDIAGIVNNDDESGAARTASINRIVAADLRADLLPPDVLFRRPLIANLVKDCYRACLDWSEGDRQSSAAATADLAARFEEFCLISGSLVQVRPLGFGPAVATARPRLPAIAPNAGRKRCVIIHYHLFKNAGTSVDAILKQNFGPRWASQEYAPQRRGDMAASVRAFLLEQPDLVALSSHTLLLPPPDVPGVEIFPIIFVRHPLDRIKSAYAFEREQRADTEGARLAKQVDFAGYVRARLAVPQERFCRNAQAFRLAMAVSGEGSELERAIRAVELLPFVGSVEAFDASVNLLQQLLAPRFPGFRGFATFANVSRPGRTLDARIAEMRAELGDDLFETLAAANADDLALYGTVLARYSGGTASGRRDAGERAIGSADAIAARPGARAVARPVAAGG